MSLEAFLLSYDGVRAEWAAGQVFEMSPVNSRHYDIVSFLRRIFEALIDEIGGKVFADVFALKLEGGSLRVPDLIVLRPESIGNVHPTYVSPRADLVIEVISPDSFERDRGIKFLEYEASGVAEYWLIDPERDVAEFYRLMDGRFRSVSLEEGAYATPLFPGLKLEIDWLWQTPLPSVKPIIRSFGF